MTRDAATAGTLALVQRPSVDHITGPEAARDLVLIAHGGQDRSLAEPHGRRPALLRMWPFARVAHHAAPDATIGLLRYRYRGWNDLHAHAAEDLRTTLDRVATDVERVILIGHSMGGRAVLRVGAHPRVVGILALAPWLPAGEPLPGLAGRRVVLAHGDSDRMTDPRLSDAFAARLRAAGVPVASIRIAGETHGLLQRYDDVDELVRRFVAAMIIPAVPDPFLDSVTSADPAHGSDQLPQWNQPRGKVSAIAAVAAARLRFARLGR
jgi:dienelactone hydrolase